MDGLTAEQLMSTAAVVLVIFGAIITVDKVLDIFKKWKAPTSDLAQKLATDKARLDSHDKSITDLQESQQVLCGGIMALLDHQLHNGNNDQMQSARDDIMKYLQRKGLGHHD